MSDGITLKPCPFCGGEAAFGLDDGNWYVVACLDCDAKLPAQYEKNEAAAAWNRRAGE